MNRNTAFYHYFNFLHRCYGDGVDNTTEENSGIFSLSGCWVGWLSSMGKPPQYFTKPSQANSASYPETDGKWLPDKVRWCFAAG